MIRLTPNKYPGKLIVFEGTDGAGKSTIMQLSAEYIKDKYGKDKLLLVKQPTDLSRKTKLFQKMMYSADHKDINYRAVQLLTLSDRIQHNHEVIIPELKKGKIILSDRYIFTSIANMLARGYCNEKWFFEACREIIRPNISFLAYSPPETAICRIKERPEEKDRYLDETQLKNVAEQFIRMVKKERLSFISTNQKPQAAFRAVKNKLDRVLEKVI